MAACLGGPNVHLGVVLHEPVRLDGVVLLILGLVLLVLHIVVHGVVLLVRLVFSVSCSPGPTWSAASPGLRSSL